MSESTAFCGPFMSATYGVISDADRQTHWTTLQSALTYFKSREVDGILFTGEVAWLDRAVQWLTKEQVHGFFIPGSHESLGEWSVITGSASAGGYIHDGVNEKRFERE